MINGQHLQGLLLSLLALSAPAETRGCFDGLHNKNTPLAERSFDDRYDTPKAGGSFSCDLYVTASQARRVIGKRLTNPGQRSAFAGD
jgi:hypothetical protein